MKPWNKQYEQDPNEAFRKVLRVRCEERGYHVSVAEETRHIPRADGSVLFERYAICHDCGQRIRRDARLL